MLPQALFFAYLAKKHYLCTEIVKTTIEMFKNTPPIRQNVVNSGNHTPLSTGRRALYVLAAFVLASLVVAAGYRRGVTPRPVVISRALFYNADSLAYYMERAYMSDDQSTFRHRHGIAAAFPRPRLPARPAYRRSRTGRSLYARSRSRIRLRGRHDLYPLRGSTRHLAACLTQ